MSLRLIEVFAAPEHVETITAIAKRFQALNVWRDAAPIDGVATCRIVARPERQQELIDQLQGALGKEPAWRMTIMPIEATIPELEQTAQAGHRAEQATREELYAEIERGARIDGTFLQLVVLSTIVAAIGLVENNATITIAAMLIAPLLGPNIAMAFASTLGDRELLARAAATNAVGVALSVLCAAVVGPVFAGDASSALLERARLGYDAIVLALASGAAGALSLTTRLASTLVGVMVGVALLPPAAALGYFLGTNQPRLAVGAAALLAVNIVCVNVSAQLVFLFKGIRPRRWIERRAAQQSTRISLAIAGILLAVLIGMVHWQKA